MRRRRLPIPTKRSGGQPHQSTLCPTTNTSHGPEAEWPEWFWTTALATSDFHTRWKVVAVAAGRSLGGRGDSRCRERAPSQLPRARKHDKSPYYEGRISSGRFAAFCG